LLSLESAPAVPVSPVLVEAVLAHNLISLVLERANSLPENVLQVLKSTARVINKNIFFKKIKVKLQTLP
jgi:hypothetical protein